MIENITSDTYQTTLETNDYTADLCKQQLAPNTIKHHQERKSVTCSNDIESIVLRDFQRDSAPFTVQKVKNDQIRGEQGSSPKQTQLETVDTIKQQLSTQDEEQFAQIAEYEALPQIDVLRQEDQNHTEFLCSQINEQEQAVAPSVDPTNVKESQGPKQLQNLQKDFIGSNQSQVQTLRDLQLQSSEKRNRLAKEVAIRKKYNPYGYKFMGVTEKGRSFGAKFNGSEQTQYRSEYWNQMIILNEEAQKIIKQTSAYKNQSTTANAAMKQPSTPSGNSQFSLFSRNGKEKAWNLTNQSSINMLPSFKTLDLVDAKAQESKLVKQTQGNVRLTQNLNRLGTLTFDQEGCYCKEELRGNNIPSDYLSFKPKSQIIHNINNKNVMSGRLKTYSSNIL